MPKVNPKNGNQTKDDIFPWTLSNVIAFFTGPTIARYFTEFYNSHLSVSMQKWAKTNKDK